MEKKKRIPWNKGLTKDDPRVAKNIENSRRTVKLKYGVDNPFNIDTVREQRKQNKDLIYTKVAQTKLERYGSSTYNNIDKNKQTKLERYNDAYFNNNEKNFETRRKNKTFNTSKFEKEYYEYLLTMYDKDDILTQYTDDRYVRQDGYKFRCDFYIKSLDLFIECNIHQGHGGHPFDPNNPDDLEKLNEWKSKQNKVGRKNQYWMYEKVWTKDDVEKQECARKNKLNYLMIYNDFEIKI